MKSFFKSTFRSLRHKNYRLFFFGQMVSLIGTMMQSVALSWMVYRLRSSSFDVGLIAFLNQIPSLVFTPIAGVLADKFDKRKMLVATQAACLIQAGFLAVYAFSGNTNFTQLAMLALFLGIINAIDAPVRQSFVIDMVESKSDLGNAIALNSALFNGGRFVGPAIGGFIIALFGEGICFLINSFSYIAIIASLLAMTITHKGHPSSKSSVLQNLKEGLHYTHNFPVVLFIVIIVSSFSFLVINYVILLPVFARDILHGGAHTLGLLYASVGGGALIGALYLAAKKDIHGLWSLIAANLLGMPLLLLALSITRSFWSISIILAILGLGMIIFFGACNTILQNIVADKFRGRVMSIYSLAFLGFTPIGNLLFGYISKQYGVTISLIANGSVSLIFGIVATIKLKKLIPQIKKVYHQKKLLPPDTTMIQAE